MTTDQSPTPPAVDREAAVDSIVEVIVQHLGTGVPRRHRATAAAVAIYDQLVTASLRAAAAHALRDELDFLPTVEPHLQPGITGLTNWLTARVEAINEGRG